MAKVGVGTWSRVEVVAVTPSGGRRIVVSSCVVSLMLAVSTGGCSEARPDEVPEFEPQTVSSAEASTSVAESATSEPSLEADSEESAVPDGAESAAPEAADPAQPAVLPAEWLGTWRSLDQGDAEVIYVFHADGTYESAQVLMQQRPSGIFSFTVSASGLAEVTADELILMPQTGRETLTDPDSPSSDFDRPLSPLQQESYYWAFDQGFLTLTNERGPVQYERIDAG